ncbi:type II toxin-antitoxin system VapC family toxin [Sphingomonas sp. RP10(2022)]|uniref:Ribonuclease VapC n=1 Tax=Sphingomonas liriopis TaxID=2949094 RepID=A0A9X2KQP2_9SPHN|nr:type II toxin-antitoxin system VapC family toxin [Sphingomonas liriopis]MCP3735939.1 type II toxin-antitoxin system VapC family toxin [Sphingomonas liriopis]
MTLFVDASAMVAMLVKEPEHFELEARFGAVDRHLYSAVSAWEASRALAKIRFVTIIEAYVEVEAFAADFRMELVSIGAAEAAIAASAYDRYGKGRHPARLNMGDCFAYACAKTHDARLLYKGDDFSKTDLA